MHIVQYMSLEMYLFHLVKALVELSYSSDGSETICVLLFIFFNLSIYFYEECGKKEPSAERGRTHLDLSFLRRGIPTCASFSLAAIFRRSAHTHSHTEVPLLRQQEWDSDFTKRPASTL